MYAEHLKKFVIRHDEPAATALWRSVNFVLKGSGVLFVIDDDDRIIGVLSEYEYPVYHESLDKITAGEICNKNYKFVKDNEYILQCAKYIFDLRPGLTVLPVIDDERNIVDLIFRFQVYYEKYFQSLKPVNDIIPLEVPRLNYAFCMLRAAQEAASLGYKSISAIEFGVADGHGLVQCEWHSRMVERLTGVEIEVYGFDGGEGLPEIEKSYKNAPYRWKQGDYLMRAPEALKQHLTKAELVIGDIAETSKTFFEKYNPAPIGAMFIDVDLYSSTVPILDMLKDKDKFFLPRIHMYFDDLAWYETETGEALAIREFNESSGFNKISPEGGQLTTNELPSSASVYFLWRYNLKMCHRFKHELYNENKRTFNRHMP